MGLVLFPVLLFVIRNKRRRQTIAREIIGKSFKGFIWMMKSLGVLSYEIRGCGEATLIQNCLIISNHPTLIDVVFLVSLFPQADCVVKSALWHNPFTRGAVAAANYIANDDEQKVIERCIRKLRGGASLILFPEGTRTTPNTDLHFKLGAAAIAVRANSNLLPIVIKCHPLTLYKNNAWYNIPSYKPFFQFDILPLRLVENMIPQDTGLRLKQRNLNHLLLQLFEERMSRW